jgi:hypothetical protein
MMSKSQIQSKSCWRRLYSAARDKTRQEVIDNERPSMPGRDERHISYYGLKKIGSIFGQSTVADDEWAREAER